MKRMGLIKKIWVGAAAVVTLVVAVYVCSVFIFTPSRQLAPHYRQAWEENRYLLEDFDAIAIENIVDDKDEKLAALGLDIEVLDKAGIAYLKEIIPYRLSGIPNAEKIETGIFSPSFNFDNYPKMLVVSQYWEVAGDKYRRSMKVKRKTAGGIKEFAWFNPLNVYIHNPIPASKSEAQEMLLDDQKAGISSAMGGVEQRNNEK